MVPEGESDSDGQTFSGCSNKGPQQKRQQPRKPQTWRIHRYRTGKEPQQETEKHQS